MKLFEAVKAGVSTKAAAEYYGIKVTRKGMACCPFHPDKTPSMKLDNRFHCFGCGADGDVVDFASKLFSLKAKDAALKLANDFEIAYDNTRPEKTVRPVVRKKSLAEQFQEKENHCYRVLCDYLHLLKRWKEEYAPNIDDEEWHHLFCEAIQNIDYYEYLLDEVFLTGTIADRADYIKNNWKKVMTLEQRISEYLSRNRGSDDRGR